jgi:VCBS repeat-containing protein
VVHGQYGTLTIDAEGNYTYVRDPGQTAAGVDTFHYTLTDGDGDTSTATLTIGLPNINLPPSATGDSVSVSEEGLVGGNADSSGTPDTTNSKTATGNITISDPDGNALTVSLSAPSGSYTSGGDTVNWTVSADGHTLVGYTGADSSTNHVIEVTIDNTGAYSVNLVQPFDDANASIEDSISFTIPVDVSDGSLSTPTTIVVTVEDDSPIAVDDGANAVEGTTLNVTTSLLANDHSAATAPRTAPSTSRR